jgi:xanthine dehydrogenase large subunit
MYFGHSVCWVLGESLEAARRGAAAIEVDYDELPALLTVEEAIAAESFQGARPTMARGDAAAGLARAAHVFEGVTAMSGQEHFYLETHCSLAMVDENGQVFVQSSTQHPTETQEITAHVLGVPSNRVTVQCLRMGGGFGGKEMQPHGLAAVAALGATLTGRPVRLRLTRQQDMTMTGKRHGYHATWKVGFDDDGLFTGLEATLTADGGWSLDLSEPVLSRALCHIDNAYWIPDVLVHGQIAKCNKTSQTAFRGFGGPQGMLVVEEMLARAAAALSLPAHVVRERNFYREGDTTHYGQRVEQAGRIGEIWTRLKDTSRFDDRREVVAEFNARSTHVKRGLAITPVKFGISFTAAFFNQAGALVLIYRDGSVQVNHGGTEMGQGLFTKIQQIAADSLGVTLDRVRLMPTRTDKVPNTSPTAASAGTDLNGAAVLDACAQLRDRLRPVAAGLLACEASEVRFEDDAASGGGRRVPFAAVCEAAYMQRTPLFAQGYYRTPGIHFDAATGTGKPFHYFAYGAAVSEVEVDGFTGDHRLLRTDILQDVGDSISPVVDRGQIEGGFIQGMGWLTMEELVWHPNDGSAKAGLLLTHAPSTYKIPTANDCPPLFDVRLWQAGNVADTIHRSKATGEPPLLLPFSVFFAIRDAVSAAGGHRVDPPLTAPATSESILRAVTAVTRHPEQSRPPERSEGSGGGA